MNHDSKFDVRALHNMRLHRTASLLVQQARHRDTKNGKSEQGLPAHYNLKKLSTSRLRILSPLSSCTKTKQKSCNHHDKPEGRKMERRRRQANNYLPDGRAARWCWSTYCCYFCGIQPSPRITTIFVSYTRSRSRGSKK